jgi:putative sterol carrier protein
MAEPPKNLDEVQQRMKEAFNASAAAGVKAVYQYCISGDGGRDFYADVDDGKLTVADGKHDTPSITMSLAHDDFLKMLSDPAAGQALFMQGKVRVEPMDMALLMKIQTLFPAQ